MNAIPTHLRARVAALGELSRPLGEGRAARLGREIANSLADEVAKGRDPEVALDQWITRIACEIAHVAPPRAPRIRGLKDMLPEVDA